jgi:hypothetical protein
MPTEQGSPLPVINQIENIRIGDKIGQGMIS